MEDWELYSLYISLESAILACLGHCCELKLESGEVAEAIRTIQPI